MDGKHLYTSHIKTHISAKVRTNLLENKRHVISLKSANTRRSLFLTTLKKKKRKKLKDYIFAPKWLNKRFIFRCRFVVIATASHKKSIKEPLREAAVSG